MYCMNCVGGGLLPITKLEYVLLKPACIKLITGFVVAKVRFRTVQLTQRRNQCRGISKG